MKNLSQITTVPVMRASTTWSELDWVYGPSEDPGAAQGRISIWSGAPGVGKSRMIAEMMKRLGNFGLNSLLFQGEVPAGQFKEEKFAGVDSPNIFLSDADDVYTICDEIKVVKPVWAFIDSVQMIKCVRKAAKDFGKKPVEYMMDLFREAINETGTHLVLISQLNKEGKTKGSNDLPHLADVECILQKDFSIDGNFTFSIPTKNRYGITGRVATFSHASWGVYCATHMYQSDPSYSGEFTRLMDQNPYPDHVTIEESMRRKEDSSGFMGFGKKKLPRLKSAEAHQILEDVALREYNQKLFEFYLPHMAKVVEVDDTNSVLRCHGSLLV